VGPAVMAVAAVPEGLPVHLDQLVARSQAHVGAAAR